MHLENASSRTDAGPGLISRGWLPTIASLFGLSGLSFATWVTQTPAVRDALSISTARMGVLLLALAAGSITALIASGRFIARYGSRVAVVAGVTLAAAGLFLVAASIALPSEPSMLLALFVFGVGNGIGDVGLNVEGSALERVTGHTVLPALHACWSGGNLLGAGIGAGAIFLRVAPAVHLAAIGVASAITVAACIRLIPAGEGRRPRRATGTDDEAAHKPAWKDGRLYAIGFVVLAMALAEGAANDWLPLAMVDGYGSEGSAAAVVYGVFVTVMMIARVVGGVAVDRFGRVATLRATTLLGVVGLALFVSEIGILAAVIGVALWGVGASLGFPVGLSAAGDDPRNAAGRVSTIATIGYLGFLAGPPLLGLLGHEFGILHAMVAVLVCLVLALFFVPATRKVPIISAPVAGGTGD